MNNFARIFSYLRVLVSETRFNMIASHEFKNVFLEPCFLRLLTVGLDHGAGFSVIIHYYFTLPMRYAGMRCPALSISESFVVF